MLMRQTSVDETDAVDTMRDMLRRQDSMSSMLLSLLRWNDEFLTQKLKTRCVGHDMNI